MEAKVLEKNKVIALRKKGFTYSQILKLVPVSKSSISLWLKNSPLSDQEKKLLRKRKNDDISRWRLRAGASLRKAKELRNKDLFTESKIEFDRYIEEPFFQVGVSLYWAEGAKRSSTFSFINSDEDMINMMIVWIRMYLRPNESEIRLRLFTHKAFASENQENFWSKNSGIPLERFGKTIYKTQGLTVKKRPNYRGCLRIELGKVLYIRKLANWQGMLIEYYKKQGYSVGKLL